jgi:hypothetical protein
VKRSLDVRFPKLKHAAFAGAILGVVGPLLYYTSQAARDYILGNGLFLGLPRSDRQTLISRRVNRASGNRVTGFIRSCDGGAPRCPADPWQKVTALQNKQ